MELQLKNLTKEYEREENKKDFFGKKGSRFPAVDQINYCMHHGVYGLLGANGAGKTTLMRMLCTLQRPTRGQVTYNGKDIFSMEGEYRKILGYLPQDFGFYPEFTVKEYLLYIAAIKGIRSAAAKKRARELLEQVGLSGSVNQKMKKLSGGMKRRVGIAQAMLNDPEILILDEPTSGLDPNERIRFRNLISELGENRLVLLSTHIVSDVECIANELVLMRDGKMISSGTVEAVISQVPVKAWRVAVPKTEGEQYLREYPVTGVKMLPDSMELRVLAENSPWSAAKEEELTLEDAFLYYFGEKAGEENGTL